MTSVKDHIKGDNINLVILATFRTVYRKFCVNQNHLFLRKTMGDFPTISGNKTGCF